jgi:Isocitrate/isopropylmalate dehydrogenase
VAAASNGSLAFQRTELPWGCGYYERTGRMMDPDGLDVLRNFDAIYFGAVGWPSVPDHVSLWGLRLNITQNFDQWANVRPVHRADAPSDPWRPAAGHGSSTATAGSCRLPIQTRPSCSRTPVTMWYVARCSGSSTCRSRTNCPSAS